MAPMLICPDCHEKLGALTDCPVCGWRYELIDGMPSLLSTEDRSSSIFNAYFLNYANIAQDDLANSIQPAEYLEAQAKSLLSYVVPIKGLRICEIGVGQGLLFDKLLATEAASLTGVDISTAYLRRYASDAAVIVANAENLPYANEFDLVIASEILEHVLNLGDLLISIRRSLVPGGRVAVRVPYKEDLRQYARQSGCPYEFVHLRTFTRDSLVSLMRYGGFQLRRLVYDGSFEDRRRGWTRYAAPILRPYLARIFAGDLTNRRVHNIATRLVVHPVTLTAVFEKISRPEPNRIRSKAVRLGERRKRRRVEHAPDARANHVGLSS
jgi:SAM-dependent methyltransferase